MTALLMESEASGNGKNALLPEEEELLREMIGIAKPSDSDNSILSIITKEAESYFQGQKSLKEVQDIIQSRAGLYISEGY